MIFVGWPQKYHMPRRRRPVFSKKQLSQLLMQRRWRVSRPISARVECLDGLRGLAALWVLMGHCMILAGWSLAIIDKPDLGVDLFMMLSGFSRRFTIRKERNRNRGRSPEPGSNSGPADTSGYRHSIILRWFSRSGSARSFGLAQPHRSFFPSRALPGVHLYRSQLRKHCLAPDLPVRVAAGLFRAHTAADCNSGWRCSFMPCFRRSCC